MTARQLFESALTELSKVNASPLTLPEFNYYINKAVNQYINKRYNIYDINQLTSDDLRVLKATTIIPVNEDNLAYKSEEYHDASSPLSSMYPYLTNLLGATYEVTLPSDYLHLLNCVCIYKINHNYKCWNKGSVWLRAATRLTSDSWGTIMDDWYNRPDPTRPYYYIHNINSSNQSNPLIIDGDGEIIKEGTDMFGKYGVTSNGETEDSFDLSANSKSNFPRVINLDNSNINISTVEKETAYRYGNASKVRMEIRYGKDNSVFELIGVHIDYIKSPQFIRITPELMDLTMDTSQIMEYPDYVCQEIINELTTIIMERTGDPRTQSFLQVSLSIANPAQALAQSALALTALAQQ